MASLGHLFVYLLLNFIAFPEFSRYLHSHLDTPINEFSMDQDIQGVMKDRWVKGQAFSSASYKEQPGLDPETR